MKLISGLLYETLVWIFAFFELIRDYEFDSTDCLVLVCITLAAVLFCLK